MSDFFGPRENRAARKSHRCSTCFRRIDPGETYLNQVGHFDGDFYEFKQCAHCLAITALYDPLDGDGLISNWGFEDWATDRARDIRELRHMAQWRRGWRRMDGGLYDLPIRDDPRTAA